MNSSCFTEIFARVQWKHCCYNSISYYANISVRCNDAIRDIFHNCYQQHQPIKT